MSRRRGQYPHAEVINALKQAGVVVDDLKLKRGMLCDKLPEKTGPVPIDAVKRYERKFGRLDLA